MIVYLDMCCFNRPFDDQSRLRFRLQTEAELHVQWMIKQRQLKLIWSDVLDPIDFVRIDTGENHENRY